MSHPLPSIEERIGARTTRYRVRVRVSGHQRPFTFASWPDAERFRQLVGHFGPERAVELLEADTNNRVRDDTPTVSQWVETYIEGLTGVTKGTRSDYSRYLVNDIAPRFGSLPLPLLARADVAAWVNAMDRAGLSGKTIKNRHAFLSSALTAARKAKHVEDNVAEGMNLPNQHAKTREPTFLTPTEFHAIEAAMKPAGVPLLLLLGGTGMRLGEATALQVRDVDLTGHDPVVRVVRAWKHTDDNSLELGPPKSRKGKRSITLSNETADLLAGLVAGRAGLDWVVTTSRGDAWRANYWRESYWHPAVKASGITKTATPHDIRHSHASWMIARGAPLPVIQARLGHEKITTTVDVYGHLTPDLHRQAAYLIGEALGEGRKLPLTS